MAGVGAAGSLGFLLRAAEHPPLFLLVLFLIWVLSPFAALGWANVAATHWSPSTRAAVRSVTLFLVLGSLAVYGKWVVVMPSGAANAALFLTVPAASWLLLAIVPIARLIFVIVAAIAIGAR
jgi:hypothetical protein